MVQKMRKLSAVVACAAVGLCACGGWPVDCEGKDVRLRLAAESGYEVDFAMKDGKVSRLELRERRVGDAAPYQRTVNIVLPDGSCRKMTIDRQGDRK